jgi:hypothetical protein
VNHVLSTTLFALGLFLSILAALAIGRRIGLAVRARHPGQEIKGSSAAEGAVFGLLGLLVAFTFSGAASRFEDRRHLITEEANAIGTAWLRVDLLPAASAGAVRTQMRQYLDARIATYQQINDPAGYKTQSGRAAALQQQIWSAAIAGAATTGAAPDAAKLLLPALNEMIDITTTRQVATRNHPPMVIFLMLAILSLMGGLLIGYELAGKHHREWLHMLIFPLLMSVTLYVILDLEFPRRGLIRIDAADEVLIELRQSLD